MKKDCENCTHYSDISCTKADGIVCCREETWRSWRSKDNPIKYEIVKPFSIIDIYEKNPCSGEYASLLKENDNRCIDSKWNRFKSIQKSSVLMRNLTWLKDNGFIKEAESLKYKFWTDTSYCKDMNLHKPERCVFPESDSALCGWHVKVVLIDTGLRVPSKQTNKEKHFEYFDSIIQLKTGEKFFTFSKFLKPTDLE